MDIQNKLNILADAAKYDVSCASSGIDKKNTKGLGSSNKSGICHTWTSDGRCVSLLKILLSNKCIYDCKYCINRISNDIPRTSFTAEEIANLTYQFYKRNYIEGLFLSSAIEKSASATMEKMYQAVLLLRNEYEFSGYIHIKAIPGANHNLIYKLGLLVDRMSVNLELPSQPSLNLLAPQKDFTSLINPISYIAKSIESSKYSRDKRFVPAGQSTQFIVGASNDTDFTLLKASEKLYNKFSLKRVYYSAYVPVNEDNYLPAINIDPPLKREHRLYQADWLLRFYHFHADELLDKTNPFFDPELDPKMCWALRNFDKFPIEINTASYQTLLRIPGIGPKNAMRIINERKNYKLSFNNLRKMRVVLKRAKYFITCNGKYNRHNFLEPERIKFALINDSNLKQMQIWER
ncbi:MAG: putative DNA modification/repair radical SAM protein [Clostridia bacterium]